ncbi:transcriptional regulator SlyA [Oxobacter pfennigii]|uniref:Transcriptional regulator SlyA n=1 Tax=Oxobacter pfennigii TaxID=36849 RepID=A0A0N8NSW2_9CLOT|nr:MarR family transcriptional regulator [Oxobacter pfennigii]KPU43144.1 transcriptional regulator SlyA [Oxobacter pfennigii]
MATTEKKIGELVSMLPMFTETLMSGFERRASAKLNFNEERTLMFLYRNEGMPMTDYCKKVGLLKGSFTAVADRLEKKGLIKRITVCNDRRKNALVLTSEGKSIAKEIESLYNEHIEKKAGQLGEEDVLSLKNALQTVISFIEKIK